MSQPQDRAAKKAARRPIIICVVMMLLSAAALWASSQVAWAHAQAADELSPPIDRAIRGGQWSPQLTPLALVLLAGVAALFATKRWTRKVLAAIVAIIGIVAVLPAINLVANSGTSQNLRYARKAAALADRYVVVGLTTSWWGPLLSFLGGILAVAAAIFILRLRRAGEMSGRYQTPAARRREMEKQIFAAHEAQMDDASKVETTKRESDRLLWDALDSGEDPTSPPGPNTGR